MKRIFLILPLFLLSILHSATQYHPKLKWREIQTEHFIIYFHQGEEEHAQYLANVAERVQSKLTSYFPWKPEGKTRIILFDGFDISNGYSTPIPYNLIGIYLIPPPGYSEIGCWDEWLNFVFTHEYIHTIQLDACGKTGKILRKISGRTPTFLHFPNLYLPLWTLEGLAVMGETIWTEGGRGKSADFDMILRGSVKEGIYPKIDRATTYQDSWPGGISPYIYGGKFMIWLRGKYGDERLKKLFESLSKNLIPYTSDWIFEKIYGKPFKKLWMEWLEDYKNETLKFKEREEILSPKVIKEIGFEMKSPIISKDGERIFFISVNPHEFPKIKSINIKNNKIENVTDCFYGNKISLSKDGRFLFFDQLDYFQSFFLYSDLYFYDLEKKIVKRITRGMRLKEPEYDPLREKILAIKYELKKTELVEIGIDGKDLKRIFYEEDTILSTPSISPDGKLIVLSANRRGNWDLILIGRDGEFIKWLTEDRFRDITPSFSEDGRYIVFSSDRDGFFNLYLYDLKEDKIFQLTNLITGAFYPKFSKDGREIFFLEYYKDGYRISKIELSEDRFKPLEIEKFEGRKVYPEIEKRYPVKPYNPLPTMKPAYWIPTSRDGGDETQYGISVMGTDPLERNIYYFDIYHGFESKNWSGSFYYIYDALYPTISFGYSNTSDLYFEDNKNSILRREKFLLSTIFPFYRVRETSFFITEFRREVRRYEGEKLNLSGLRFGILYNNSKKYPFSISPTEGRRLSFLIERDFKELGSDYNIWKATAEWKEYIKMPLKHHVLGIRLIYGKSWGERRRIFFMGGYEGNTGFAEFETDNFNLLRGYKKESIFGTEAILLNIEYRFPILNVERGYGNFPLFLRRIHLAPFFDAGNAWINSFNSSEIKRGIGIELRGDFILSYSFPITFSIGLAKGLDKGGEGLLFFRLSNSF
jgi:hypothetical protein